MDQELNFRVIHSDFDALAEIMPVSLEYDWTQMSRDDYMEYIITLRNQAEAVVTGLNELIKALGGDNVEPVS